jgi:putative tryptophan/tyrosine transport system substrate-binding protein
MRSSNQWWQMRFNHLRRREFIILLGGAVGAWPFAGIAQSPAKVYRIGLLSTGAALADTSPQGAPLIRGLAQHGYVLGRNLAFERRGSSAQTDRLPVLFDELVASRVDVIITSAIPPRSSPSRRARFRQWPRGRATRSAPVWSTA